MNDNNNNTNKNLKKNSTHDSFFAQVMSNLEVARDFLTQNLPAPLLEAVDLNTLAICKDKYISHNLESKSTDILYRLKLKEKDEQVYVYSLTEHQSTPQKHMPLRVAYYESLIMMKHWKNYKKVPLVHTIVYYNGNKRWNYPSDIKKLIDAPAHLIEEYALRPFQLVDLNDVEDEDLRKHLWAGVMGTVMKHIRSRNILLTLQNMMDMLRYIYDSYDSKGGEFIESVLYYVYEKGQISDEGGFRAFISELTEEKLTMASLCEQHEYRAFQKGEHQGFQKGEHQGRQKGRQEGEAAVITRLLQRRFKTIPKLYLDCIAQATSDKLLEWSDRLLTATTLGEVFEDVCQVS